MALKHIFILFFSFLLMASVTSVVEASHLPSYMVLQAPLVKPDLTGVKRLLFLTTTNFPPFNYMDKEKHLLGYNIDLVRAICNKLNLQNICQVSAVPWSELETDLMNGKVEAIIAGLAPSPDNIKNFAFSEIYFRFPARFVGLKSCKESFSQDLSKEKVGVIAHSAHEKLLFAYFPKAQIKTYLNMKSLLLGLQKKDIKLAFGDGYQFSMLLLKTDKNLFTFVGKPYFAPQILWGGMQIATLRRQKLLVNAFNYALQSLEKEGKLQELYLRYFPIDFF